MSAAWWPGPSPRRSWCVRSPRPPPGTCLRHTGGRSAGKHEVLTTPQLGVGSGSLMQARACIDACSHLDHHSAFNRRPVLGDFAGPREARSRGHVLGVGLHAHRRHQIPSVGDGRTGLKVVKNQQGRDDVPFLLGRLDTDTSVIARPRKRPARCRCEPLPPVAVFPVSRRRTTSAPGTLQIVPVEDNPMLRLLLSAVAVVASAAGRGARRSGTLHIS
jgi:hypothetical protein